jgi:hypothetical protein
MRLRAQTPRPRNWRIACRELGSEIIAAKNRSFSDARSRVSRINPGLAKNPFRF